MPQWSSVLNGKHGRCYDICIVGGGPVGLTAAVAMSKAGASVCVVDAGDAGLIDPRIIQLSDTYSVSSIRGLGGGSSAWGNVCAPLRDFEMSDRPWLDTPGWPISYADLEPYYETGLELCGFTKELSSEYLTQFSRPAAGAGALTEYSWLCRASPLIFVAPDSDLVDIITGVEIVRPRVRGGSCVGVVARSADGLIQIDANATLLAAGALSNTEILMQADQAGHPTFRASSALGRYLSDHYRFLVTVENVNARELSRWLHGYSQHEYIRRGAAIDLGIQADLRLVSASIYLSSLNGTTAKFNVEVEQPPEFENRLEFSPKGLTARFLPGETVLTTLTYAVEHLLEDLHVPSSARSMLEDHIRKNATQLTTISHPSGTTRMGPSPDKSVVNSHLQVHGVSGLYVCGASVFPTAGVCNPTLTSIALALRFVDHALGRTAPRRIKSELAK